MAKDSAVKEELSLEERQMRFQEAQLEFQRQQLELQKAAQVTQKELQRQGRKKRNDSAPLVSPMNPQGEKDHPMPLLKCEFWFGPFNYRDGLLAGLTWEEVELINLLKPGEYQIRMNDDALQSCCVVATMNHETGEMYKLELKGPRDDKGQHTSLFTGRSHRFPSMVSMLRQLVNGCADEDRQIPQGPANDVLSMKERKRRVHLPNEDPLHLPISIGE